MDSITQAILGAAVGESLLGKRVGWKGATLGAIVATIPDLDIVLTPFFSELEKISIHRGYSHSILFCILASIVLAYVFKRINWTKAIGYYRLYLFSFLLLFTHVILDAFTSYGTQLFLPFTDWRVSFDSISIIDPVYTLPLILGLISSLFLFKKDDKKRSFANAIGLIVSSLYLLFTLANKQNVEKVFYSQLEEQSIPSYNLLTVPTKLANVNWYGVARDKTHLYIGQYSSFKKNKIEFHAFPINDELLMNLDPWLVNRMIWFAQGFYTVAKKDGKIRIYNMQCDMQGVRQFGKYKAPTAFYYEITPGLDGDYELDSGMQKSGDKE